MRHSTTVVLFALAACGQQPDSTAQTAVTLPTDPVERAQVCTAAAMVEMAHQPGGSDARLPAAQHQEWTYYNLLAAKARYGDAMTYVQLDALPTEIEVRRRTDRGYGDTRRAETLAACRAAFPAATGQAAVTLPADADEAALQCAAIARAWPGFIRDLATDAAVGEAQGQRVVQAVVGEIERIASARNAETEQEVERMFEQAFARSVGLGRPDKVLDACERRFVSVG